VIMEGFPGFPPGKVRLVALPEPLFGELMPLIDDLAELKVTLHCYWRLSQGEGAVRFIRRHDLLADQPLLAGLKVESHPDPVQVLDAALERAVARGTLLHVRVELENTTDDCYFANTPRGRAAVQQIERGEWSTAASRVARAAATRPNIFVLYEQNIGLLQPLIAEELRDAGQTYPEEWIEEAFRLAAAANVRRWIYVRAILERWATEGKTDGVDQRDSEKGYERYTRGKYADWFE
jgi:DNA replication protein